jgi:pantetheine-phosphate adenylyltransferase
MLRERMAKKRFKTLALGGTFDILHKGHEKTLMEAFSLSEKVLIGLSTDSLIKSMGKRHEVNPYEKRKRVLENFLHERGLDGRFEIIPINHRWGVAHELKNLDAIMVSKETYPIALEINKVRRQKGLKKLEIVVLEKLLAENGKPISSTRIRAGEIDREGHVLKKCR